MYKIISSLQEIGDFLKDLSKTECVGLDIETSGLDPHTCRLYSLQLNLGENQYFFDLLHFDKLNYLMQLLENKLIIGHNLKFDLSVLKVNTGILPKKVYDTMLSEKQLSLGVAIKYASLLELVAKYCDKTLDKEIRKTFINDNLQEFTQEQITYAIEDVIYLFDIRDKQRQELEKTKQLTVVEGIEMPLLPCVITMELEGIKIDVDSWRKLVTTATEQGEQFKKEFIESLLERLKTNQYKTLLELVDILAIPAKTKRVRESLVQITDSVFYPDFIRTNFNIDSPKQIVTALNLVGISTESSNEKVLKELGIQDELLDKLYSIREQSKKVSSFGENFIERIHPKTGHIHTTFNQLGTATGRFSSESPNLQQIPREQCYRSSFIADDGYVFICYDFNQQEYRLAGAITGEPRIIEAYCNGADMHTMTASLVYGVDLKEVSKEQRSRAKNINFAILYGSTEAGLAYNFKISMEEARDIINKFYSGYPIFSSYKKAYEEMVSDKYFSKTLTGRRRYFERKTLFESPKEYGRYVNRIKREGFNQLIQGTGADITKLSLINIFNTNPFGEQNLIPVLQVHDEIVLKVKKEIAKEAEEFVIKNMLEAEQKFLGKIPAKVEGCISDHWTH